MPISVVCTGCKSRFSVSDQFAGRTGPCPKCKKPITIPKRAVAEVTIHEPEAPAATGASGRMPTAPIVFKEAPLSMLTIGLVGAAALACMAAAFACRTVWGPGLVPTWILAIGAIGLAFPCAWIGYAIVRDREFEAYRGRGLAVRCVICAAVYATLWAAHSFLPVELMHEEFWRWLFVGPVFGFAGALAALATLDLDWGTAGVHFACYVIVTAILRWITGLPPI
ncbi:MAG: hypothetical protein ACKOYJ_10530 [Planctomycetia bacterium]